MHIYLLFKGLSNGVLSALFLNLKRKSLVLSDITGFTSVALGMAMSVCSMAVTLCLVSLFFFPLFATDRCLCVYLWKCRGSSWMNFALKEGANSYENHLSRSRGKFLPLTAHLHFHKEASQSIDRGSDGHEATVSVWTEEKRRVRAWEREGRVWERGLQGWPSNSLLSCHSPALADRFIGHNNQSVYHPALLCTGSSCNWLLHLETAININFSLCKCDIWWFVLNA